jgi:hypothetical protein
MQDQRTCECGCGEQANPGRRWLKGHNRRLPPEERRERANARARERYHSNRERELARLKKWAEANPEKRREYQRKWYEDNLDSHREYNREYRLRTRDRDRPKKKAGELRRQYGLTMEEYKQMLHEQGGGCAICGAVPPEDKWLHVDHCHESGAVRGLLCSPCNTSLGGFRDRADLLRKAATYIEARQPWTHRVTDDMARQARAVLLR